MFRVDLTALSSVFAVDEGGKWTVVGIVVDGQWWGGVPAAVHLYHRLVYPAVP
jgi:hypothetical protein